MKLTKRLIDAFKYEGGWDVRWDDEVPGLGVRIYPSGKKAFVLSYRVDKRKRLMVLGRVAFVHELDVERLAGHRLTAGQGPQHGDRHPAAAARPTAADTSESSWCSPDRAPS